MWTFRPKYTNGKLANTWTICFTDHQGNKRRIGSLQAHKRNAEVMGQKILDLVGFKVAGMALPPEMTRWLQDLPPKIVQRLAGFGLIDTEKVAALLPLRDHIEGTTGRPGWRQYLMAKGNTKSHVDSRCVRALRVVEGAHFTYWQV